MMRLILGAACLLSVVSAAAQASGESKLYGAGLLTYERTDDVRDAKFGYGGYGIVGYPVLPGINLELTGFADGMKRKSDSRIDAQYGLGLDANIMLSNGRIATFIIGGGGAEYDRITLGSDNNVLAPYADGGVGAIFRMTKHLGVRAEARYYYMFNDSSYAGNDGLGDVRFNLGIQYALGTVIPANTKEKPASLPAAVPEPIPAPIASTDSDGDGVSDEIDACPNTPAGVVVDAKGCPLDSDGDGVPDYLDKCPGTPKSFKVDTTGCIVEQTVVLHNINFEFGSDKLTASAREFLDEVAEGLRAQPTLGVEVTGHTDSLGTQAANLRLSERRANSVRSYLVGRGIDGKRLKSEGLGEFSPVATNKTEEGRALNRRVEFKLKNLAAPATLSIPDAGSIK